MNTKTKSCAVPECILRFDVNRHFFRFPKEYDRWLQWVRACGRSDLEPKGPEYSYRNMRMCHLHFEEKWIKMNKIYARLHPDAVPTIFFEPHFKQQFNANEIMQMGMERNVSKEKEELNEITQVEVEKNVFKEEEELNEITQTEVEKNVFNEEELSEITQVEVEKNVFKEEEELNEITQTEVEKNVFNEEELSEITQMEMEKNVSKEEEKLHKSICAEVAIQVEEKNKGTSAAKSGNVTTHTKKLLDDSPRKRKLHLRIKKLEAQNKTLRQTVRRLRMKEKIYKTIYKIILT
ncbi:unnamed protein product [Xylocopa violacea]|uniref:THAP-type domain-containing protein n=1 Tax=Xylocopa violacea TaxID=135666 RepID=A0ABP1N3D0_XYLVO